MKKSRRVENKTAKRASRSSRKRGRLLDEHARRDLDGNSHRDPKFRRLLAEFERLERRYLALKDKRLGGSRVKIYGSPSRTVRLRSLKA
jgi:hypothetical protein